METTATVPAGITITIYLPLSWRMAPPKEVSIMAVEVISIMLLSYAALCHHPPQLNQVILK